MSKYKVAVVMGSESDMPIMQKAAEILQFFGVEHGMTVSSAHRSPTYLLRWIKEMEASGVCVFIAGAGGAAHLAGVIAAHTTKPVIGVPITSKLLGLDSLLSTVQMPKGVPVATVAVDGAANAAVLAVQILAVADSDLKTKLVEYKESMAKEVESKSKGIKNK
ncbi:MAG: 5-(carboxyamino)imidazole ribonucleotide mutase [Elusimicrobia bacterium]|nr:5-(carboxyamino)imidazole ribonucleotide mutase [Elusimicrobiota bacterium]